MPGDESPLAATLPSPTTPLVGRADELDVVVTAIRKGRRLVTLTGTGGVGKTRLAVEAAHALSARFDGAVLAVWLAPVADASAVSAEIARAAAWDIHDERAADEIVRTHLRARPMLLVLDNCEHLDHLADVVADVMEACRDLTILATSRRALTAPLEHVVAIDPLPVADSLDLLTYSARRNDSRFAVTNANRPAVTELVTRLDGVPLSLHLAAARLHVMTPDEMVRALDSRFDVLKGPGTTHAPHHAHLLTMIDWSYRLLSDEDRRRFRALGAFPHTFTREAAATVTGSDPLELLDTLDTLVSHHLVRAMDRTGPAARFGLLETIHEFVVARLTEHGEGDACRAALAEWCAQLATREEALLGTPDGAAAIERLDVELDNLRAAMAWSVGPGADATRAEYGLRIAGTLWRYWPRRGLVTEATNVLTHGLALGPRPSLVTADALLALGAMAMDHGDLAQAIGWFERCAGQYDRFADDERMAVLWVGLATCYRETTRLDEAEALYGKALAAHVAAGRTGGQGVALNGLAATSYRRGDFPQAVAYWQQALDIARERGQPEAQVHLSSNIGLGLVALDDYDGAFEAYSHGIAIAEGLGDPQLLLMCCANRAEVETTRGNFAAAQADLDRVAELADPSDMRMQVILPTNRGVLARGEGRLGDALELLHAGLAAALAGGRQMEAVQIVEAATIVAAELDEAVPVTRWLAYARAYRDATGTQITNRVAGELAQAAELAAARGLTVEPGAAPSAEAVLAELGAVAATHAGARRALVSSPDPLCALGLSAREAEVARLLVARLTDQEIADRLHIGIRTVATHVAAVRRKLDVPGRRGVAARLAELGFEFGEPD